MGRGTGQRNVLSIGGRSRAEYEGAIVMVATLTEVKNVVVDLG